MRATARQTRRSAVSQESARANRSAPAARPRILSAALLGLAALWSTFGLYVVHAQLPTNALDLPFESELKTAMRVLVPEGWAFFTRNPREERFLPFRRRPDGTWSYAHAGPHAEARNAFGLNRASRAQGVEVGLLQGSIPAAAWQACDDAIVSCLEQSTTVLELTNQSPNPTLCGAVALALQEPLPWAWAAAAAEETMPSKIVRLDLKC